MKQKWVSLSVFIVGLVKSGQSCWEKNMSKSGKLRELGKAHSLDSTWTPLVLEKGMRVHPGLGANPSYEGLRTYFMREKRRSQSPSYTFHISDLSSLKQSLGQGIILWGSVFSSLSRETFARLYFFSFKHQKNVIKWNLVPQRVVIVLK
jgi:hypothetical protein